MGDSLASLDLGSGTFHVAAEGAPPSPDASAPVGGDSLKHASHPLPPKLLANFSTASTDTEDQMRTLTSNIVSNADALAMRPVLEKHDSFRHSPLLPELRAALAGEGTNPDSDPLEVTNVDLTEEEGRGEGGAEGNAAHCQGRVSPALAGGGQTKAREHESGKGGERSSPADSEPPRLAVQVQATVWSGRILASLPLPGRMRTVAPSLRTGPICTPSCRQLVRCECAANGQPRVSASPAI